jgi:hypothetical protein
MNTRQSGLEWLRKKGRSTSERVVVSKYYTEDESFTHSAVWWFEFLERYAIDEQFLNLLCQVAPGSSDFHHLRVPMRYFLEHKQHIWFREDKVSFAPHLSAEKSRLFRELRGDGQVEFALFKVD